MSIPTGFKSDANLLIKVIDQEDIDKAVMLVREAGRYEHVIYHLAFRINAPTDMPYFKSTYPSSWLGYYVQNQYADIDPVILHEFKQEEPFFWADLPIEDNRQVTFFKDAFEHGAGKTGFSIPLIDRSNRKALFSVTSNLGETDWKAKIEADSELLLKIGDVLHRRAIMTLYGTDQGPVLAPREIECLYWTARGKDAPTVAQILNISEYTVRDYLKSARHKLGCTTIAHAIHEATKRRLIQF